MKKVLLGLFIIVAGLSTGCLGGTQDQIIGAWTYYPVNPNTAVVHPMQWQFVDNGTFYLTDLTSPLTMRDTGSYELFMDGTHRKIKFKNIEMGDPYLLIKGEWFIVRLESNYLVVGTKEQGGFQQRDLVR